MMPPSDVTASLPGHNGNGTAHADVVTQGKIDTGGTRAARGTPGGAPLGEKKVAVSFLLKKFVDGAELPTVARHLLWTSRIPPAMLAKLGCREPESPLGVEDPGEAPAE